MDIIFRKGFTEKEMQETFDILIEYEKKVQPKIRAKCNSYKYLMSAYRYLVREGRKQSEIIQKDKVLREAQELFLKGSYCETVGIIEWIHITQNYYKDIYFNCKYFRKPTINSIKL